MRTLLTACVFAATLAGPVHSALADNTTSSASKTQGSALHDAYKREFAFLESEKRALTQRIAEQEKRASERKRAITGQISSLQTKVVAAAGEAERLDELVQGATRDTEIKEANEGGAEDILLRADSAFQKLGVSLPKADTKNREEFLGQLRFVFQKAPEMLRQQGQFRHEDGVYFDGAGNQVKGSVLRIGNVASYGLVPGAQGVLAPAGENRLKLWETPNGSAVAAQLAQGGAPETMPIFLYETLAQGFTPKGDKSVLEVIRTGGLIAWVIVALGCLALTMIVVRSLLLLRASRGGKRLLKQVLAYVEDGKHDEGLDLTQNAKNPMGRVLTATLQNLHLDRERMEDVVAEALIQEQSTLSRFGSSILVLAAVSPLLGLLGTVTGMISTFDVITEFGTGNPKLLSGGISEALVTTELGLVVAIPALLLGHVLSGWSDSIRDGLDASALATVNRSNGLIPPSDDDDTAKSAFNDDDVLAA